MFYGVKSFGISVSGIWIFGISVFGIVIFGISVFGISVLGISVFGKSVPGIPVFGISVLHAPTHLRFFKSVKEYIFMLLVLPKFTFFGKNGDKKYFERGRSRDCPPT